MSEHLHSTFQDWCFRCHLSRDEARSADPLQALEALRVKLWRAEQLDGKVRFADELEPIIQQLKAQEAGLVDLDFLRAEMKKRMAASAELTQQDGATIAALRFSEREWRDKAQDKIAEVEQLREERERLTAHNAQLSQIIELHREHGHGLPALQASSPKEGVLRPDGQPYRCHVFVSCHEPVVQVTNDADGYVVGYCSQHTRPEYAVAKDSDKGVLGLSREREPIVTGEPTTTWVHPDNSGLRTVTNADVQDPTTALRSKEVPMPRKKKDDRRTYKAVFKLERTVTFPSEDERSAMAFAAHVAKELQETLNAGGLSEWAVREYHLIDEGRTSVLESSNKGPKGGESDGTQDSPILPGS